MKEEYKKIAKQVMKEFAEQDKVNARLAELEARYNGFIINHEFGKVWLGNISDGGYALVNARNQELGRWAAGMNCWADACDIAHGGMI